MTIKELRCILTNVDRQDMTIKELRDLLFEQENQDQKLNDTDLMKITYGE